MSRCLDFDSVAPGPDGQDPDFVSARSLKRELLAELERGGDSDNPVQPEDLLVRWPSDPRSDPDVASVLFADYQKRQSRGESLRPEAYEERFPEHKDSFSRLIRQHELLRSIGGPASVPRVRLVLPAVGDEVFGFRLRFELGAGAFARVFLAEQADLAGRPVVLKTSDRTGDEPQTLAQLQHTHIVPIHSVHEDEAAGLRAVCMPYFGGASFSAVLQKVGEGATSGEQLVEALRRVQAPTLAEVSRNPLSPRTQEDGLSKEGFGRESETTSKINPQSPLGILRAVSYPRAVAWVIARLAEGLHHAHQRGVLHRDIKPSNVLLTADGQPMLLDFNLSQSQADGAEAVLGGTVAYMAPEHLRALNARTPALTSQVDHRSDIYSLGMVLFEALTGHNPFGQSGSYSPVPMLLEAMAVERARSAPSVRASRPDVAWGLESIVCKCLAPNPADRYQQADQLAEDLRRFLADDPLRHTPELSWVERGQKWVRRHPRLSSSGSVALAAAVLLGLAGLAIVGVRDRLHATSDQLAQSRSEERRRAYQAGTVRAQLLVNANTDLLDHTRQGLAVCEATLGLYGVLAREDWQSDDDWLRLGDEERRRLAEDTRELLLLLAWARVRVAPGDRAALRGALELVERAEAVAGLPPSPALWQDRARYRKELGDDDGAKLALDRAKQLHPANARDHYLLAAALARSGSKDGRAKAISELDRSLELNPEFYWAWFQRGICHLKGGDHHLAAADFGACVGLWPAFAWGHFNLGCAHDRGGRKDAALLCYTAALARDPEFLDAYLNRGMLLLASRRFEDALTDFTKAAGVRQQDPALHAGRGMALAGLRRHAEADSAFASAFAHLDMVNDDVQNRIRCGYGFAVMARLPEKARGAFEQVITRRPQHAEALYGRASLSAQQGRSEEAVRYLERAVASAPAMMEARHHLAIQLARSGRFTEAFAAINWCLERQPHSAQALYAGACVAARAAERARGSAAGRASATKAIYLLREAFARGQDRRAARQDPDLAGIRDEPEFIRLVSSAPGV